VGAGGAASDGLCGNAGLYTLAASLLAAMSAAAVDPADAQTYQTYASAFFIVTGLIFLFAEEYS
jgi:hypothetical protein